MENSAVSVYQHSKAQDQTTTQRPPLRNIYMLNLQIPCIKTLCSYKYLQVCLFALQCKKKQCLEWECNQFHLVGKLNLANSSMAAAPPTQRTEHSLEVRGIKYHMLLMKEDR